jgi:cytochrome b involved in lipid metabolism
MLRDPCLALVESQGQFDPDPIVQFLIKFSGIAKKTPPERIVLAVAEEVLDLAVRARAALEALPDPVRETEHGRAALGALDGAIAASRVPDTIARDEDPSGIQATFPRAELESLAERGAGVPPLAPLVAELRLWCGKHRALEDRLKWLIHGTTLEELKGLDPIADCDRIHTAVSSTFRVEGRILETVVVNRIAQSAAVSLFFRSTREAEDNAVARFYDTFILLANFFEWGADSKRGRAVVSRLNQIHGRYYAPNAGMKYVLLQTAFTFLDGADQIAHRPLLDVERRGYFHAYVKLGRLMNIGDITDDYDAMYRWYQDFNRANAQPGPIKKDTFETIVGNSFGATAFPQFREAMDAAFRVAMDETFRSSLGYAPPTEEERIAVRAVFLTLGKLVNVLPPVPYLRSLQNNPARAYYHRPGEMGVNDRSRWMPAVDPARPNGGYPEWQKPILSEADIAPMELPLLDWKEIARHNTEASLWVVIDGFVYDLTHWAARHPGGLPVLLKVAGKDGSRAFHAARHSAATEVFKLNYRIGRVAPAEGAEVEMVPGRAAGADAAAGRPEGTA